MRIRISIAAALLLSLPAAAPAAVVDSLAPLLINHYTFDDPLGGDVDAPIELDLGIDLTNIQLLNGAPRVADGAWWGSRYSLETAQRNTGDNDDWKAGVMFSSSAESTLAGTNHAAGVTVMGWFKPLGSIDDNPSPNTNTPNPFDFYNAFGLAGLLRGDEGTDGVDGHAVRALLEVINGKVAGLARRLDDQPASGSRYSVDDWYVVMPPKVWTHLAAAFDFEVGTIELYKNGLPLDAEPATTENWETEPGFDRASSSNAAGIKIGGSYPDNSQERNPFNGRIDELMFFSKALSADEALEQFLAMNNVPGDFNRDGIVDAADYSVWRDGFANPFTAADYENWKNHFGALHSGTGGASRGVAAAPAATVPEPQTIVLLIVGLSAIVRRRAGRQPRQFDAPMDAIRDVFSLRMPPSGNRLRIVFDFCVRVEEDATDVYRQV